ncbi:LuxR C-terminal-related transcriptional regulator [Sphingopyxis sp. R3-92]|uniref:LuxR C-terminal-related transcriptional regulator n=1 Tax=Sphingopyxis sp. R3-92 TaxID=3158553 RepID=UPI003EE4B33D
MAPEDAERWSRLSDKQHACLELLLARQTSKQIARELDISKYTVDQRLTSARYILGAGSRDETAIIYDRLKTICDRIAYHPVDIPTLSPAVPSNGADGEPAKHLPLRDSEAGISLPPEENPLSRSLLRHDHQPSRRTLIMVGGLLLLVLIALGGIGIAQGLNQLIAN